MNLPEVAIAILYQNQQFLMQLRDDIPGIFWPAHWAFFGGHLDPGETPEIAMLRELQEEIGYRPPQVTLFERYEDVQVIRHVFYAPLTVPLSKLELNEGWDLGLLTLEDVRRGDRYSDRAQQVRPLGAPHQKILLEFCESGLMS
ncbi:NUDIX hydrolase [Microcoleus sp. FACHB-1515]|uniref:NUDIX hydrolase n=1 Tax=Cyanophyceae TaxID=3028117 RepID=UPI0016865859|nr:NUDIX hydrolase [Microcoleus sp. FACHB-1515]MBD2090991.1 NUDIX hydrolase [Microcoleus sp. FACHB-1515]